MGVSVPQQAEYTALPTKLQANDHRDRRTDTRTTPQPHNHSESTAQRTLESKKQVRQHVAANPTATRTDVAEPEHEQDVEMEQVQTPARYDEFRVISSDVSPHDSDFDFLQLHTDAHFSLLTPSPHHHESRDTEVAMRPLTSSPVSSRGTSIVYSPSKFFKSPLRPNASTFKTSQDQTVVPLRLETPRNLLKAIESLGELEEKKITSTLNVDEASAAASSGNIEATHGMRHEHVVSVRARPTKALTVATPPCFRTLSAPQQLLTRCLEDVFEQKNGNKEREIIQEGMNSPAETTKVDTCTAGLDADDMHCVPSGSLTSLSEHDSFFSFANSLSPLMAADEFENSFIPVKLSPLVSLTCELPRLLPPFPEQEPNLDRSSSSIAHAHNGTFSAVKTPKNKPNQKRGLSSAASLAVGNIATSGLVSPNCFAEFQFPNIQASTSATPGQDERSKLGAHSVMKMKLHTSFGASSSLLDSHSTREIQAINNSLKRKKFIRRRKAEEKHPQTFSSSNVQRRLLQTPVKLSTSPRTITRSPLHPWNGQSSQANIVETPTSRKLSPSQQTTTVAAEETPSSPLVVHRLVPATDPIRAPTTPVGNPTKRKGSQCVSMPSSMASISGLKMRKSPLHVCQAVALAVTPAKQIKREVTTALDKYSISTSQMMVTCDTSDMASFDSGMFQTPTRIGSSISLATSLQSASDAPLGVAVTVLPSQVPKKAPCNCKKSKCLKLYCECFRLGGYCDESCNCFDCANTTATEEVRQQAIASRLEKNPNAFKSKIGATPVAAALTTAGAHRLSIGASGGSHVSMGSLSSLPGQMSFQKQQEIVSAALATTKMHKHGCHCKKSACQKKYCECFQAGVPCGKNCRCIDCKNQTTCVAHGNGVATAKSRWGTPSRIANELDETFVSPVLQGVRKRMRMDRETWKKDFLSPVEASRGRERDRTEGLQSGLLASRSVGAVGTRPFTTGSTTTPQVLNQTGTKRSRGIMSPVGGQGDKQRGGSSETTKPLLSPKNRKLQQYSFADRIDNTVGKAALSAVARSSAGIERVFVLPLFGAKLPPLENGVSAKIFCYLTNADLHNASLVSHLWNQVALGDTVWDHANFIPTRENAAAGRYRQKKKTTLKTLMKLEPRVVVSARRPMVAIKHEPNFAMLSTLR